MGKGPGVRASADYTDFAERADISREAAKEAKVETDSFCNFEHGTLNLELARLAPAPRAEL
jgi:hypothetical protein